MLVAPLLFCFHLPRDSFPAIKSGKRRGTRFRNALTQHADPGRGPDGLVPGRGSNLALVDGVVPDRCVGDLEVELPGGLAPEYGVSGKARQTAVITWKQRKKQLVRQELKSNRIRTC